MLISLVIFGITTDFNRPVDRRTTEERVIESVVRVNSAAGIVVHSEADKAIVLTAYHVIAEDCEEDVCNYGSMLVSIHHEIASAVAILEISEYFNVINVDVNIKHDLALVEVATSRKLESSQIYTGSNIRYGDDIYIASNPNRLFRSLKKGIVGSPLRIVNRSPSFEISGGVIFGSSGGGVFNTDGELIGTITNMNILRSPFCYSVFSDELEYVRDECVQIPLTFIGFATRPEIINGFIEDSVFCEDFNYQCIDDSMETMDEQEEIDE